MKKHNNYNTEFAKFIHKYLERTGVGISNCAVFVIFNNTPGVVSFSTFKELNSRNLYKNTT